MGIRARHCFPTTNGIADATLRLRCRHAMFFSFPADVKLNWFGDAPLHCQTYLCKCYHVFCAFTCACIRAGNLFTAIMQWGAGSGHGDVAAESRVNSALRFFMQCDHLRRRADLQLVEISPAMAQLNAVVILDVPISSPSTSFRMCIWCWCVSEMRHYPNLPISPSTNRWGARIRLLANLRWCYCNNAWMPANNNTFILRLCCSTFKSSTFQSIADDDGAANIKK